MNLSTKAGAKNTKAVSTAHIPKDSANGLIAPARKSTTKALRWKWCAKCVACVAHTAISMRSRKVKKTAMAIHDAGPANMPKALKKAGMAARSATVYPTKAWKKAKENAVGNVA